MQTTAARTLLALLLVLLALALWNLRPGVTPIPQGPPIFAYSPITTSTAAFQISSDSAVSQAQPRARELVFLELIETETDPDRRSEALGLAVGSIALIDLQATLDWLPDQTTAAEGELRSLIVRRWAELDAPAAATWAARLPAGAVYQAAVEEIAIAWANADLPAAIIWARALPEGAEQQATFMDLAYEAARTEPINALVLACVLPATLARDDLIVHAVSQWAIGMPTSALDWAQTVPDIGLRERLLGAVTIAVAQQDGAAAATLVVTLLGPGEEQDRAAVAIVQRWAAQSPENAASWVEQFPDTPAREAAIQNLVILWARRDSAGAADWLDQLPDGSIRTAGLRAFAQTLPDNLLMSGAPMASPSSVVGR
jgi:hypothetical protein